MSDAMIGILGFVVMLGMIFMGFPVFTAMLIAGLGGFFVLGGSVMALAQFTAAPFAQAASYSYAVLPFFMLVGILAGETGIAEGAYAAVKKWTTRSRGGLLTATICANTVFGACSGIPTAGNIVFTKIALPELDKAGYDRSNSLACIVAAGCLASLIPPSIPIINFCILNELSITRALMCGVGAGIITTIVLIISTKVYGRVRPEKIPPPSDEKIPMKEKLKGLKLLLPILGLFAIIVGGSFTGFFSATVGGAIGSVAVLVYALAIRMPIKKIGAGIWEAVQMNARVFPMLCGGVIFGRFIAFSRLPDFFTNFILDLGASPFIVFTIIVIFYVFCGCIMDLMTVIIITTPVVFPMLTVLGFDPYAMCMVLVLMVSIAGMTPPVGNGVFIVSACANVDPTLVFKGIMPYFLALLACTYIIAFFPQLVTFLPNLMG